MDSLYRSPFFLFVLSPFAFPLLFFLQALPPAFLFFQHTLAFILIHAILPVTPACLLRLLQATLAALPGLFQAACPSLLGFFRTAAPLFALLLQLFQGVGFIGLSAACNKRHGKRGQQDNNEQ
jgi:hypothetical protein